MSVQKVLDLLFSHGNNLSFSGALWYGGKGTLMHLSEFCHAHRALQLLPVNL